MNNPTVELAVGMQIVIAIIFLIIAAPLLLQLIAAVWFLVALLFNAVLVPLGNLIAWLFTVAIVPTFQYLSFMTSSVLTPGLVVVGVVLIGAFVVNGIWQRIGKRQR